MARRYVQARGFQIAGRFTHKPYYGNHGEDADIAELGIGNSADEPEEVQPTPASSESGQFLAPVDRGESGGPVYYRNADGTATPVGITIRAADSGGTIAELIGPGLKRWDLSLDRS